MCDIIAYILRQMDDVTFKEEISKTPGISMYLKSQRFMNRIADCFYAGLSTSRFGSGVKSQW